MSHAVPLSSWVSVCVCASVCAFTSYEVQAFMSGQLKAQTLMWWCKLTVIQLVDRPSSILWSTFSVTSQHRMPWLMQNRTTTFSQSEISHHLSQNSMVSETIKQENLQYAFSLFWVGCGTGLISTSMTVVLQVLFFSNWSCVELLALPIFRTQLHFIVFVCM